MAECLSERCAVSAGMYTSVLWGSFYPSTAASWPARTELLRTEIKRRGVVLLRFLVYTRPSLCCCSGSSSAHVSSSLAMLLGISSRSGHLFCFFWSSMQQERLGLGSTARRVLLCVCSCRPSLGETVCLLLTMNKRNSIWSPA